MVEFRLASDHLTPLDVLTTSDSPKHVQLHGHATGHGSKSERPHGAHQRLDLQLKADSLTLLLLVLTLQNSGFHEYVGLPFRKWIIYLLL